VVTKLKAVGAAWSPNASRPPLPTQRRDLNHVITAVNATATSTASGSKALNAVDGINDGGFTTYYTETVWQSAAAAPQSLTIDLGKTYSGIDMLSYHRPNRAPASNQGLHGTHHRVRHLVQHRRHDLHAGDSQDGLRRHLAVGATQLAGWASAEFNAVTARYVRLQATSATGSDVKINEVDCGGRWWRPWPSSKQNGQPCTQPAQTQFGARRQGGRPR